MLDETRKHFGGESGHYVARASTESEGMITGYGSVYETPYQVRDFFGPFVETMATSGFTKTMRDGAKGVVGLFNHNPDRPLGSVDATTMRVWLDERGLMYEIKADMRQSQAKDAWLAIERGDVPGSSVTMIVVRDRWSTMDGEDQRAILEARLIETGPVLFPASKDTSTQVRSELSDDAGDGWQVESAAIKVRRGLPLSRADLVAVNTRSFRDQLHALEPVATDHSGDSRTQGSQLDTAWLAAVENGKRACAAPPE